MEIEKLVIKNLVQNEDFCRKTLPYLKKQYFENPAHVAMYELVLNFISTYNKLPNSEALLIEAQNAGISTSIAGEVSHLIQDLENKSKVDEEWLMQQTEKWCRDRAIYGAIMDSIQIIDGKDPEKTENAIPEILQNALSVGFEASIGHNYIDDADSRFDFYHREEDRMPFDLDYFNQITKGGIPNKTLNICLAGTGVGKSLFMCHVAASAMTQGKNVLYITMEMAEERIAERIDANLMNLPIDQLEGLSKNIYDNKIAKIAKKSMGKFIIKEYPTGSAHSGHFRALLKELKMKKDFEPDIIFIDYLNICASSRMKGMGGSINSYTYVKAIAEELRGLAVEFDVPIFSATQTTRSGFSNTDVGLEDTSESFGLPATADLMFALISTEELENLGQLMVKQLKNRYNDPTKHKRFVIGVDRARMKLFDVEESAQENIMQEPTVVDNALNTFGNRENKDFGEFKV